MVPNTVLFAYPLLQTKYKIYIVNSLLALFFGNQTNSKKTFQKNVLEIKNTMQYLSVKDARRARHHKPIQVLVKTDSISQYNNCFKEKWTSLRQSRNTGNGDALRKIASTRDLNAQSNP
eukprot:Selendium_serpulae@DN3544_c0_g1_i1.p2